MSNTITEIFKDIEVTNIRRNEDIIEAFKELIVVLEKEFFKINERIQALEQVH